MIAATVTPPRFPAHVADRIAAAHRPAPRFAPGDSDPDANELLHRVRSPRSNFAVCPECNGSLTPGHVCPPKAAPSVDAARLRVEIETAYVLRDRQPIDAYNEWAAGVSA